MSILDRVKALMERKYFRSGEEKIRSYEEFLLEELKPFVERIDINVKDLAELHGRAAQIAGNVSYNTKVNGKKIYSENSLLQAYCYLHAAYALFKLKGIVIHDIRIGDDKDDNEKGQV